MLKDLLEKRARLVQEMRAITEKPEGEGDLSEAQARRFDELKGELEAAEKSIQRQQLIDEAERRMEGGTPVTGADDDRFDVEARKFSVVRALAGQAGMDVDDGREREISKELSRRMGIKPKGIMVPRQVFEKRVLTTAAPGAGPGSNLVSTDHLGNQYIDSLRAKLVVRRLGARVINDAEGDLSIPKLKASATGYWVAENGAITASDPQFEAVSMSPKHVGCITEYSRNMLLQSSPDVEQILRDDFAKLLARAIDTVCINGGGSNEPDGVLQTSGIGSVTFAGSAPTWAEVLEFIEALEIDDAEGSAWVTHPKFVKLLRSTPKEVDGSSIAVSADYLMDGPSELAGYPLASTTLVPTNLGTGTDEIPLIFGAWSDLIVAYWSGVDLLVNPYESTAYSKGNVQIRGIVSCDCAVRHPESFASGNLSFT